MEQRLHLLNVRIAWCQRLRALTDTREQKEGWLAEEEGLHDAVGCRDRTDLIRACYPAQVERYHLGFEDGHALLALTQASHSGVISDL